MSTAREIARPVAAPAAMARPPATLRRADGPPLARRFAGRLTRQWLPRAAWTIGRTGRAGLVGIALLLASALFLFSTHLPVAAEIEALRADLGTAQGQAPAAPAGGVSDPSAALRALPARTDVPAILRRLFSQATQARLAIDTGKYEIRETRSGGVIRTQVAFPVTGSYPQIRTFLDRTLATMPALALDELLLERKSIAEGEVEAQIRMTIYTAATGTNGPPGAGTAERGGSPVVTGAAEPAARVPSAARPDGEAPSPRVVDPRHASALFAQHSWTVLPPQPRLPPPPPPLPPPPPAAPPLPYTFVGSYAPAGDPPVFFLSRGDSVIDARVGDRIDGEYQLESAAGGQLVFVYLPLNIRQNIPAGVPK